MPRRLNVKNETEADRRKRLAVAVIMSAIEDYRAGGVEFKEASDFLMGTELDFWCEMLEYGITPTKIRRKL